MNTAGIAGSHWEARQQCWPICAELFADHEWAQRSSTSLNSPPLKNGLLRTVSPFPSPRHRMEVILTRDDLSFPISRTLHLALTLTELCVSQTGCLSRQVALHSTRMETCFPSLERISSEYKSNFPERSSIPRRLRLGYGLSRTRPAPCRSHQFAKRYSLAIRTGY